MRWPALDDRAARWVPLAIVAYFAATGAERALRGGALNLDEAEMAVLAQALAPGYGAQPPLYAWLQIAANAALGEGAHAHAALKHALLALTALGLWTAARLAGAAPRVAAVAALSLALLPAFLWESQRALTHTVLTAALGAWACAAFAAARTRGGWGAHLALGALAAAMTLAKLNGAFLGAALLAAAAAGPGARPRRALGAAGLALALLAPYALWMAANPDLAAARSDKLALAGPSLEAVPGALRAFAVAMASNLALLAAAHGALVWTGRATQPGAASPARAGLTLAQALALAAVLAAMLATGAGALRERWLHAITFAAPLLAALWAAPRVTPDAAGRVAALAGALALAVAVALPVQHALGGSKGGSYTAAPFAALSPGIAAGGRAILADSFFVGGNLRHADPGFAVLTPQAPALPLAMARPDQLVWDAAGGAEAPAALRALLAARFGAGLRPGPAVAHAAPWPGRTERALTLMVAPVAGP